MKTNKLLILSIGALLVIGCCMVGGVGAEEQNLTVLESLNVTNATAFNQTVEESEPIEETTPVYRNTEQYQTDYEYWYNYYTQDRTDGYEASLREQLRQYMDDTEMSESERWDAMLILMGYDFRLENYLNTEKRTIDEETGEITYSLGVGNWWANLFNSGVDESKLPQTLAEGEALLDIYHENYKEYFSLMLEIDTE